MRRAQVMPFIPQICNGGINLLSLYSVNRMDSLQKRNKVIISALSKQNINANFLWKYVAIVTLNGFIAYILPSVALKNVILQEWRRAHLLATCLSLPQGSKCFLPGFDGHHSEVPQLDHIFPCSLCNLTQTTPSLKLHVSCTAQWVEIIT